MDTTSKPDLRKGDYVGLTKNITWAESGEPVDRNAWAVTDPYLVKGVWHITINFDADRFKLYWASYAAKHDHNLRADNVYLVERKTNKLKEFVKMKLSKQAIYTAVVLAVVGLLLLIGVANYNDLVRSRNDVSNSKSKIDTELSRRYDLIDNIVASVKGSQAQESDVFGKIAEARKLGGSTSDPEKQAEANNAISTQIALLPRLQEAYPELRSNDQVTRLIQELQGTNNTIRDKRNFYNDTVTNYNNNVTSFPKSIFAAIFDFDQAKLFEAPKEERVNPKVDLNRE